MIRNEQRNYPKVTQDKQTRRKEELGDQHLRLQGIINVKYKVVISLMGIF